MEERERREVGSLCSKKLISKCMTEWGHYPINEKERIDVFKYYRHIIPSVIYDLHYTNGSLGAEHTQIMPARRQKTNNSGWAVKLNGIYCQAPSSV